MSKADETGWEAVRELRAYRALAWACYQQMGRLMAPAEWLDMLLAASEGRPFDASKLRQFDTRESIPLLGKVQ